MYIRISAVLGRDSCGVKQNFLLDIHFVKGEEKDRKNQTEGT
jgi:hypothetical protein